MKILLVKLAAFGDVLRTTSLLRPLHARYPGCEIWWLTSREAMPLLEGNPWVHEVVTPEDCARAPLGGFDLVVSMEESEPAASIAGRACARDLVGVYWKEGLRYTDSSAPYYSMSLLNRGSDGGFAEADALKAANTKTYAELWLEILGLPVPKDRSLLEPILTLANADRREAWETLRGPAVEEDPLLIGVNPGAGKRWPAKQLSEERSALLLAALAEWTQRKVVLFGGPDESRRNADILRVTHVPVIDPGTNHPLRRFAAMLDLCSVVVTTDSLAFHVATALRKEAVVFVGPTSAAELDTFGRGVKLLPEERCSCFYKTRCSLPKSCLDEIPLSAFVKAVQRCLPR